MKSIMLWGTTTQKNEFEVLVDVHSGSVGVAILQNTNNETIPTIIFSYREVVPITDVPDPQIISRALSQTLFNAALELGSTGMQMLKKHNSNARISKVFLSCGAPWAQTVTRFINIENKESFTVTEEKMKALIAEAERRDESELKTSEVLAGLEMLIAEHAVVHVAINGYFVHEPYGKEGTELSLAHISGFVPKVIDEAIKKVEEKIVLHTGHTTHTFALILFCVARDMFPTTKHALIIDISGEATEICVMQEEVLMETCIFSYGTNSYVRDVAQILKTFPQEALGHVREYGEQSSQAVKDAVNETTKAYVQKLSEALGLIEERYALPKSVMFLTSDNVAAHFDIILQDFMMSRTGSHDSLVSLNHELEGLNDLIKKSDVFFALEARFFHKLHACGDIR